MADRRRLRIHCSDVETEGGEKVNRCYLGAGKMAVKAFQRFGIGGLAVSNCEVELNTLFNNQVLHHE